MITRLSGRPREFDEATALAGMMQAFWVHGYEGTSLSELVRASNVKKGSLYAAFGDKHQLYLRSLDFYLDGLIESVGGLLRGPGPLASRLRELFEMTATRVAAGDRRGCFLCNASTDIAAADADVERLVRSGLARLEQLFSEALGPAYPTGQRAAKASQLLSVYMGLQALARSGYPAKSISAIVQETVAEY